MKTMWFLFSAATCLLGLLQVDGSESPKVNSSAATTNSSPQTAVVIQESWLTISNRWGSVPIDEIRMKAESGEVSAQYYMGCAYAHGNGVSKDLVQSFKWVKLAADQGLARAQRAIGLKIQLGEGVAPDPAQALNWYQKSAKLGDQDAEYLIGTVYSAGTVVAQDYAEAAKHFRLGADHGSALAQNCLACLYREGLGVGKDAKESVKWFRLAADQGLAEAQRGLGYAYETATGATQDYAEAARLYRLAADQGDATAQNNLGGLYYQGNGVPMSPIEAVKWFTKSADQGYGRAAISLAWIYAQGAYGPSNTFTFGRGAAAKVRSGGFAPDHGLAVMWIRKGVDVTSAEGAYQIGRLLHAEFDDGDSPNRVHFAEAGDWFKKAAEKGHDKAQYELAKMYHHGELGDRENCIPWFLKAADQGNAEAQAEVGKLRRFYPNSKLLRLEEVVVYQKQSAASGNIEAQFDLSKRYQMGDGVPQDYSEAFKWMEKAARQYQSESSKVSDAQYELAMMYEHGEGVRTNSSAAHDLMLVAASDGQPNACFFAAQMFEHGDEVQQDDYQATRYYFQAMASKGGGDFRGNAAENLLRLYSKGRGLPKTNEPPKDFFDHELANRTNVLALSGNCLGKPQALYYLGSIYYEGKLVPQDLVKAAVQLRFALSVGVVEAGKMLEMVEAKMTSEQKDAAQSQYDSLKKNWEMERRIQQMIRP